MAATLGARLRRGTYLAHRWAGIAGCLLMALWFASGVVMLFVGYPKLTPRDRVQALPMLPVADYLQPSQAMPGNGVSPLVLNAATGRPRYIVRAGQGGLAFTGMTLTWIFSGLMSMNPLGIFSATVRPDLARYAGATPGQRLLDATPREVLQQLRREGFTAVELEWKHLAGEPFILARDVDDRTRIITVAHGQIAIRDLWPVAQLQQAAARLLDAPIASAAVLLEGDAYYYRRDPDAMMGGAERGLPALLVRFADAGQTRAYIDLRTGAVALTVDRSQRVGRWLFNFLHSWDLRGMLAIGWLRDLLLIVFSVGGFMLSVSGVVIGLRRLRGRWRGKKGA